MSSSANDPAAAQSAGALFADSPPLILASASPSRAAVMRQAGLMALSEPAQVDETAFGLVGPELVGLRSTPGVSARRSADHLGHEHVDRPLRRHVNEACGVDHVTNRRRLP